MTITMKPLTSSALASAGYNPDEKQLRVQFHNGSSCTYYEVPQAKFDALMSAKSAGKFHASAIKGKFSTNPPRRRRS
jgi:KTSC domain